jgi:hypothetical protein
MRAWFAWLVFKLSPISRRAEDAEDDVPEDEAEPEETDGDEAANCDRKES